MQLILVTSSQPYLRDQNLPAWTLNINISVLRSGIFLRIWIGSSGQFQSNYIAPIFSRATSDTRGQHSPISGPTDHTHTHTHTHTCHTSKHIFKHSFIRIFTCNSPLVKRQCPHSIIPRPTVVRHSRMSPEGQQTAHCFSSRKCNEYSEKLASRAIKS